MPHLVGKQRQAHELLQDGDAVVVIALQREDFAQGLLPQRAGLPPDRKSYGSETVEKQRGSCG